jgi:hypothetical protein
MVGKRLILNGAPEWIRTTDMELPREKVDLSEWEKNDHGR